MAGITCGNILPSSPPGPPLQDIGPPAIDDCCVPHHVAPASYTSIRGHEYLRLDESHVSEQSTKKRKLNDQDAFHPACTTPTPTPTLLDMSRQPISQRQIPSEMSPGYVSEVLNLLSPDDQGPARRAHGGPNEQHLASIAEPMNTRPSVSHLGQAMPTPDPRWGCEACQPTGQPRSFTPVDPAPYPLTVDHQVDRGPVRALPPPQPLPHPNGLDLASAPPTGHHSGGPPIHHPLPPQPSYQRTGPNFAFGPPVSRQFDGGPVHDSLASLARAPQGKAESASGPPADHRLGGGPVRSHLPPQPQPRRQIADFAFGPLPGPYVANPGSHFLPPAFSPMPGGYPLSSEAVDRMSSPAFCSDSPMSPVSPGEYRKVNQSPPMESLPPPYATQDPLQAYGQATATMPVRNLSLGDIPGQSTQPPATPSGDTEPDLCAEQDELVRLVCSGRNVFYTGSAGCGKSTALKTFVKRLRLQGKIVKIIAPTGRAALDINGSTTWTYAGWTPGHLKRPLKDLCGIARSSTSVRTRISSTDVLIIDEISMVENHHLERLNTIMKAVRQEFDPIKAPFGGVQLVVTGDFCQLPPVKPFQFCLHCGHELRPIPARGLYRCKEHGDFHDRDKWAFRSQAWADADFAHFELREVHRQKDESFVRLLRIFRGLGDRPTARDLDLLMNHPHKTGNAVRLLPRRADVEAHNAANFAKLRTRPHGYDALDMFQWNRSRHPALERRGARCDDGTLAALNDHRYARRLVLKQGMPVVLLANLDLEAGLVNGSQGIVCGFEPLDPARLPRARSAAVQDGALTGEYAALKEAQVRAFIERRAERRVWPVVKFPHARQAGGPLNRTIFADCTVNELGDEEPYSLLCRTQIPLMASWAMTVHKAQGMTLSRVCVNVTHAFEEGQVYVAISRATSLEGLKVEGDPAGLLVGTGGNPEVKAYMRQYFGHSEKNDRPPLTEAAS